MEKYYFCIDVGGTETKGGIIDEDNNIICQDKISSADIRKNGTLAESILELTKLLEIKSGLSIEKSQGLGIGLPGLIDSEKGIVKFMANLNIKEYDIVKRLKKFISIPIKIANDAELALIAEQKLGSGQAYKNFAMITLGTGVGSGLVIDGKPLRTALPFSCEIGHNFLDKHCENCIDSIASTRGLVNQTKQAMESHPESKMWSKYNLETVDGKTVFEFKDSDKIANDVFENFIQNLGTCITNLCNVFTPEAIIVGGGISRQDKKLTSPLETFVNNHIFLKNINYKVKVIPAKFLNDAGILGARCLFY